MKRRPEVFHFAKQKQHLDPVYLLHKPVMLLEYDLFSHINHPIADHAQNMYRISTGVSFHVTFASGMDVILVLETCQQ